jgi:hypothetical protein
MGSGGHAEGHGASFGCIMLSRILLTVFLVGAVCADAQQASHVAEKSTPAKTSVSSLPKTSAELAKVINASYYHADGLAVVDCDVAVDWPTFYRTLRMEVPAERVRVLEGLKMHTRAVRGMPVDVRFDWGGQTLSGQDQIESGMKQMIGGFYQMYWPMLAGTLVSDNDKLEDIQSLPDGGVQARALSGGMKLVLKVNRDGTPGHYEFDGGSIKGAVDMNYAASPNPVPGDSQRVTGMKIDEQIGASIVKIAIALDYQDAGDFRVPKGVSFGMVGSYTVNLQFAGCKASSVAVSQ